MKKSKHLLSTYYVPNSFYILSQLIPQQPHAAGIMIIHTTIRKQKFYKLNFNSGAQWLRPRALEPDHTDLNPGSATD